jgi:excisionase family DNA binding protein
MTVKEAAKELTCSISFVYKLMNEGQIAYERRGRRRLPVSSSVADYRQQNLVPARPASPGAQAKPSSPKGYKHLFK